MGGGGFGSRLGRGGVWAPHHHCVLRGLKLGWVGYLCGYLCYVSLYLCDICNSECWKRIRKHKGYNV